MRVTYCMQRDQKTDVRCSAEISWERFKLHGAICDSCEKKKQIVALPNPELRPAIPALGFQYRPVITHDHDLKG